MLTYNMQIDKSGKAAFLLQENIASDRGAYFV